TRCTPRGITRNLVSMTEACMSTAASERPITFAGVRLGCYRHICAFFQTQDEEYRLFLLFIKEGLAHGEKASIGGPHGHPPHSPHGGDRRRCAGEPLLRSAR